MQIKGFENKTSTIETPNDSDVIKKPLKNSTIDKPRVDINVLKSKLRDKENTVLKKNIAILVGCLVLIIAAGIGVTYL
jgi:hypothetical protein|tara:strand:+ start:164 stop:397 length:234 start_codon:yes stop_codon:yes gene_type:complete